MKRTVFDPLGMTNSSYVWQSGYDTQKVGRHNTVGELTPQNKPDKANAAASLHTTAQDYGRFIAAILKGTGLKKETVRQMLTPQIKVDEAGTNMTARPANNLSPSISWGLGVGLQSTPDGISFWHWRLIKNILANGAEAGLREYRQWRTGREASEVINENQMNRLGYSLIGMRRVKDAIEVFKLNVEDYPQSSNRPVFPKLYRSICYRRP